MRAGRLDRRITLQVATRARDASGSWTESWANVATDPVVWAGKRDTLGSERVQSGAETATADTVFVIRWRADLTASHRVVDDAGAAWDIIAPPTELGRRDGLELTCRRVGT